MLTQEVGIQCETDDMDTPTMVLETANVIDHRGL